MDWHTDEASLGYMAVRDNDSFQLDVVSRICNWEVDMNSIVNSKVNSKVNSETLIDMARDAGIQDSMEYDHMECNEQSLERFAALVRADEREACAKEVDHILKEGGGTYGDAIRARGNT